MPVVAGMFYPEDGAELHRNVEQYLSAVPKLTGSGKVYGLVVPHAGYVYSGKVAAYSYARLQQQHFTTAIVIGPSHREYFDRVSVYPGTAFRTPLGDYLINEALREKLLKHSNAFVASAIGHRAEHSVEVQVPFLQVLAPDATFLPLVMGTQTKELCNEVAQALITVCSGEKDVVLFASSDLSHYHPYEKAVAIDSRLIEQYLLPFDFENWMDEFEADGLEACGAGPIGVVMKVSRALGASHVEVLKYNNSGDVSGDMSGVVGYVAAAFVGE